jgi:hypothetical protein
MKVSVVLYEPNWTTHPFGTRRFLSPYYYYSLNEAKKVYFTCIGTHYDIGHLPVPPQCANTRSCVFPDTQGPTPWLAHPLPGYIFLVAQA